MEDKQAKKEARQVHLDEDVLDDIKEQLATIPPLPLVVTKLMSEVHNPKSNAQSVAEIASSDPVLAANLLRAINSSFYGIANEVTDVRHAIALLGFDMVQTLVMQFGLAQMFKSKDDQEGYNTEDLWIHSLCVSLIAMTLSRRVTGQEIDRGFVATFGLLHDVGKLAINSKFPDKVGELFREEFTEESFLKREERLFGADHAFIGAFLGREWDLPEDLIQAIQWHHFPKFIPWGTLDVSLQRSLMLIHIANQIAKFCHIYSEDMEIDLIPDEYFTALGLPPDLEANIDRDVKGAINRGIFFVDQITDRPLRAVQRILRTKSARDLSAIGQRLPTQGPVIDRVQIRNLPPVARAFKTEPRTIDVGNLVGTEDPFTDETDVLFICPAEDDVVRRMVGFLQEAFTQSGLPKEIRFPFYFLSKFLLGNALLLSEGAETIHLRLTHSEKAVILLVECPALAFQKVLDVALITQRQGTEVAQLRSRALLAAGLGNILALEWVQKVEASPDGTRLLFYRKRA